MDSGIGTEMTCKSESSSLPQHDGIGRTASDLPKATAQHQQQLQQHHSCLAPTRSQSMKVTIKKHLFYLNLKNMFYKLNLFSKTLFLCF
jgi:hypothetical protein